MMTILDRSGASLALYTINNVFCIEVDPSAESVHYAHCTHWLYQDCTVHYALCLLQLLQGPRG
jgi:hypothetical protein